jgi:2-keto-3-deoxy-L-rhamnonate aldolase RhmA
MAAIGCNVSTTEARPQSLTCLSDFHFSDDLRNPNRIQGGSKVKWIRERALQRELLGGTFLNLGSSLTAEIAGNAGFDWLLIDLEHGAGDRSELLLQLQAIESTPAVPLVRIPWNDPVIVKRVLDLGASGIMVP